MPAPFTDLIGTDSFTESLRQENLDTWLAATNHRFVAELFDGSIAPQVMAGYLVQDYRFLDTFLALIGGAIANADTLAGRLRLSKFAGEIAGDENTYFLRCFETLGVTEHQRESMPDTEATTGFKRLFLDAAASGSYAAILSVLMVCEGLYLDWASKAPAKRPESFVHHEWITLHDYPEFRELVDFLRRELDRVGPSDAQAAREFFSRAVELEQQFFDESYTHPLP